ncbi:MAG: nuclear prelamin A recognition factor family protein, partial [Oscillospiraceae bacterium]
RDEFITHGMHDVDTVITTQELIKMIKEVGIQFDEIDAESPDMPFALYSGAGVIFGVTGGVTEAVIRRLSDDQTPKALHEIEFTGVRGMEGVKEFTFNIGGLDLRIGVVSGLGNAESLIKKIVSKEEHFDFVEVMACPGGCVSGAGQPVGTWESKKARANGLYKDDKVCQMKRSQENPTVKALYDDLLKNRTSELLHVHYHKTEE